LFVTSVTIRPHGGLTKRVAANLNRRRKKETAKSAGIPFRPNPAQKMLNASLRDAGLI
jgi:hypothetical protein